MAKFIPGLQLSRLFYIEAVAPIIKRNFPDLEYAAGRIDKGSDVLGFDTARSRDHDWGLRVQLFLLEKDSKLKSKIDNSLKRELPAAFHGYPTDFGAPDEENVRAMGKGKQGNIKHYIEITTVRQFFNKYLNIDPYRNLSSVEWLILPEQRLLTIAKGKLFHDSISLSKIKQRFDYYPRDVWLYLLASQWNMISPEEAFVGRAGEVGDEVGSKLIAVRTVEKLMKLCFLMEKEYAPYSKWFGTAFRHLKCSKKILPIFKAVLQARSWKQNEVNLSRAYEEIAKMVTL